jgi:effector-binding domain-containing protein
MPEEALWRSATKKKYKYFEKRHGVLTYRCHTVILDLNKKTNIMEIKEVKPTNFLFYRTRATINELTKFIPVGQQLYKEAVSNNLPITGPVQWHYYNFVSPSEPFDLEVALPVGNLPAEYDGHFHLKRTDGFKCIAALHEGSWYSIPETYNKIMQYAGQNNLKTGTTAREVYINVDLKDMDANLTEIQYGIG